MLLLSAISVGCEGQRGLVHILVHILCSKMAQRTFTDRWLRSAGPFDKTQEFVDLACPNLWVRIGKRRKTFSVLIGPSSGRRRISIGRYPDISLSDARKKASELLGDPRAAGGGRPRPGGRLRKGSVRDLFEFVIAAMEAENKTASVSDYRLYLLDGQDAAALDFGPATLARNVTPEMVTDWLAKFHERGKSTRLPRAILSAAFNRGVKADNDPTQKKNRKILFAIRQNPVSSVGGPTQSNTRDRSLSFEELVRFWSALKNEEISGPARDALQVVIAMGGVRITEVTRSLRAWWKPNGGWRSIDAPRLSLPKTKNGHPHDLPVTRHAKALVDELLDDNESYSDYLFPGLLDPSKALSLETLSRSVAKYCEAADAEPFTPRDLRRSMKNLLLDRDTPQNEVDIWHNHGRNADVARRNYDRAEYEHAKGRVRDAIDALLDDVSAASLDRR